MCHVTRLGRFVNQIGMGECDGASFIASDAAVPNFDKIIINYSNIEKIRLCSVWELNDGLDLHLRRVIVVVCWQTRRAVGGKTSARHNCLKHSMMHVSGFCTMWEDEVNGMCG